MGFFCKDRERLKVVDLFYKKAPLQMFDWVLNTPLKVIVEQKNTKECYNKVMVTSIKLFPYSSKFIRKDISCKSVPSKTTKDRIDQAAFVTVLLMAHMTIGV